MTKGYTIKSISEEGIYYLVNHWEKYKAFWKTKEEIKGEMLFKTASNAKASLTKLLKIMPEYKTDCFEIIELEV